MLNTQVFASCCGASLNQSIATYCADLMDNRVNVTQQRAVLKTLSKNFKREIKIRQTISFIEISIEAGILLGGKHEACFVLGMLRAGIDRNQTHAVLTKLAGTQLSP